VLGLLNLKPGLSAQSGKRFIYMKLAATSSMLNTGKAAVMGLAGAGGEFAAASEELATGVEVELAAGAEGEAAVVESSTSVPL
jgi:hypothetical protein